MNKSKGSKSNIFLLLAEIFFILTMVISLLNREYIYMFYLAWGISEFVSIAINGFDLNKSKFNLIFLSIASILFLINFINF